MRAVVGSIQGVPRPASISAWLQALSLSLPYRSSFVFLQGQGLLLHRELLARSLPLLLEHDRGGVFIAICPFGCSLSLSRSTLDRAGLAHGHLLRQIRQKARADRWLLS